MNEKQQREYAALKEQELREQDARLARLEARARDEEATDELAELTGIRKTNAQLRDALARFNAAAVEQLEQRRSEIEAGAADAANDLDRIAARLARIDEAAFHSLEAEFDETDAEIREADAWLAQRLISIGTDTQADFEQVKQTRDDTREQRQQAAAASEDTRSDKKNAFRRALDELKAKWHSTREKIHRAHRETQPEQHP
jgi:hypothetical protein